jgi:hypothetical protein
MATDAPRLYIFHGSDADAVDEAVRRVVEPLRVTLGPPVRFGPDADPAKVHEELYTSFLGGGAKLVLLRDATRGASAKAEGGAKAADPGGDPARDDDRADAKAEPGGSAWAVRHKDFLKDVFRAPPEDAVFVLATPRWPLAGLAAPEGAVVRGFDAPKEAEREQQAPGLVASLFAARRKRVGPEAIRALLDRLGTDRGLIAEAVETLALHAGARAEVTAEDIEALVRGTRPGNAFHMTRACVLGEGKRALEELGRMLARAGRPEEYGPKTLGAIAWQYRVAARTCEALAGGIPRFEALRPWYVRRPAEEEKLLGRLRALHGRPLARARRWILEADLAMKSSRLPPRVALETLVVKLAALP